MGLLQESNAIFYHPLNDAVEHLNAKTWTGTTGFAAGKVSDGLAGVEATSPSFSSESEFLAAATSNPTVTALTSTKVVVTYSNQPSATRGEARVGIVNGADITWGPMKSFATNSGDTYEAKLDSSRFVLLYVDSADSSTVKVRIGTVSGTDITFGATTNTGATTGYLRIASFSSTHFIVIWKSASGGRGASKVGLVSGTDITLGAQSDYEPDSALGEGAEGSAIACLSSTAAVVCYEDRVASPGAGIGTARIGIRSGTDITWGAKHTYESGTAHQGYHLQVTAIDAATFVVAWNQPNGGNMRAGAVSGTGITLGGKANFDSSSSNQIDIIALSAAKVVVAWADTGDSYKGKSKLGTISGLDITLGAESQFQSGGANGAEEIGLTALGSSEFVVVYRDDGDGDHGTAKVGNVSSGSDLSGLTADYSSAAAATKVAFCGWLNRPSG